MVSNSEKMTMEERIAQRMKESELGSLFEESDLTAIITRAIEKAFFQDRRSSSAYDSKLSPPLLVELAQETFQAKLDERINEILVKLLEDDDFRKKLNELIISNLSNMTNYSIFRMAEHISTEQTINLEAKLKHDANRILGIN